VVVVNVEEGCVPILVGGDKPCLDLGGNGVGDLGQRGLHGSGYPRSILSGVAGKNAIHVGGGQPPREEEGRQRVRLGYFGEATVLPDAFGELRPPWHTHSPPYKATPRPLARGAGVRTETPAEP
jgi:hypothetical protein